MRSVFARVLPQDVARLSGLDVTHSAGTHRRTDFGPVPAQPLPRSEIAAPGDPAALLVVLCERGGAIVVTKPPTTIADRRGEARRRAVPSGVGRREHDPFPLPGDPVVRRRAAGLRADRAGRQRIAATVERGIAHGAST